jgi:molybdopterin-guanine dinucleotide biosynthesis protein MobB
MFIAGLGLAKRRQSRFIACAMTSPKDESQHASPASPRIIAIAAPSGTGKTTLIEALIRELRARGLRVGAVKSDAHRVELDRPGKDTHRMRESGAEVTALVSRDQIAVFRDAPGPTMVLHDIVKLFFPGLDVVVAEGFRSQGVPTIVLEREGVSLEGWDRPEQIIARATDRPEGNADLDLNDPPAVAEFIIAFFGLERD